jgi:hypothetical protein
VIYCSKSDNKKAHQPFRIKRDLKNEREKRSVNNKQNKEGVYEKGIGRRV